MRQAGSLETFVAGPVDAWVVAGPSLVWCATPNVAGATVWGSPNAESTRDVLRAFEALWGNGVGAQVDLILDARAVERVDPSALAVVLEWTRKRGDDLLQRVRQQIGVVHPGVVGVTLSGILPVLGKTHPFRVLHDPFEAHRAVDGPGGERLCAEIQSLVESIVGVAAELRDLRALLRTASPWPSVAEAARALSVSTRTLQRVLLGQGTTFARELREAQFVRVEALLLSSDEKIAAIAHQVAMTEGTLTNLVHERTGHTPAELRRKSR